MENVEKVLGSRIHDGLEHCPIVEKLWKPCGKTDGLINKLLEYPTFSTETTDFSTFFPLLFPQKIKGFPQGNWSFIKI